MADINFAFNKLIENNNLKLPKPYNNKNLFKNFNINNKQKKKPIEAVCVITNKSVKNLEGYVLFKEDLEKKDVIISVKLKGLSPGKHGFHIHKTGDLRKSCKSLCAHYNPFNQVHGGPNSKIRHVGDLGNIIANKKGEVNMKIRDKLIKLRGKYSIIGRSVVIHQDEDDLGKGGNKESLITGNAGARIGCGVIGYV